MNSMIWWNNMWRICRKIDLDLDFEFQIFFFLHYILLITKVKLFPRNHRSQSNISVEKMAKKFLNRRANSDFMILD